MKEANGERLRDALRACRDQMDSAHATRLHRAVSWLRCAEQYADDDEDMSFIALWVAFNSCYAINDDQPDHTFWNDFQSFTDKIVALDEEERVYNCLWFNYSNFIRLLVENQWVYGPFWQSVRAGDDTWKPRFEQSKKLAFKALANNEVSRLLSIIMDRLYVLRNQLIHGGATWQSRINRDQVRDGKRMLLELVPVFIEIMMKSEEGWGEIHYPVIEAD